MGGIAGAGEETKVRDSRMELRDGSSASGGIRLGVRRASRAVRRVSSYGCILAITYTFTRPWLFHLDSDCYRISAYFLLQTPYFLPYFFFSSRPASYPRRRLGTRLGTRSPRRPWTAVAGGGSRQRSDPGQCKLLIIHQRPSAYTPGCQPSCPA